LLVRDLPPIHKDPFDRILIAQAKAEGLLLLTSDKTLTRYDAPILYVPKKPHSGGKFWLANRPGSA
jgi:PIN domain nuclease of toxin-antitoxin system